MIKELALADIRIDGGTQQRVSIDEVAVQQFANAMRKGADFPEIHVAFDGSDYWIIDGFHRLLATRKNGKNVIKAEVSTGTRREAVWLSLNVNQKHGLRRKYEDVKKMLWKTVFIDSEWTTETDTALAEWIGCSVSYIVKQRKEYEASLQTPEAKPEEDKEPEPPSEPEPEPVVIVIDELGHEVPKHLEAVFNRRPEIKEQIKTVSTIFKTIKDAQQRDDLLYVYCKGDQLKADLGNFRRNLRFTLPYAVCPMCGGDVNNQECKTCDQHGFVNEAIYQAVPAEMKGE